MNYMQNLMQLRGYFVRNFIGVLNMFRYIITPLLFCCFISHAMADDILLQEDHPDRYVVVKGDTLWAISGKFLKDPWQWPKVWKMNKDEIKNPHRIYPGDVVVLDTSSGSPQLRLLHETVTLSPGAIEEPLEKQAIPVIMPSTIAPFLNQPLVIEKDELTTSPVILAGPDNRVAFVDGNKIYTSEIEQSEGYLWHIYRPGKVLVDPDTREALGIEATYLGDARITKYGDPTVGEIFRSKEEIFKDDKLIKMSDNLMTSFVPRAPETLVKGRIMTIYGGLAEAGNNTIVSINKGKKDGLEEGHVLSINRAGSFVNRNPKQKTTDERFPMKELRFTDTEPTEKAPGKEKIKESGTPDKTIKKDPTMVQLPSERIGLLMIFRTFDRVSYGLIMQATQPINVLDITQTP